MASDGWVSRVRGVSCVPIGDLRVRKCLWRVAAENVMTAGFFFYHAAEFALKPLCAFVKGTAGRDQWNGGRRRRNSGCFLSIHASLRCSSPPPSPLWARVCVERERVCDRGGGTAGVGQSVNAADSHRRFPGHQRRKAPVGSLYITSEP